VTATEARSSVRTWAPEDGPATVRTASGATYVVDGDGRIRGGSLGVAEAVVCGAVDPPDGRIRGPGIVVGLRMAMATPSGLLYSSAVAEIQREPGAMCA
jgi:hypothetical protein